MKVNLIPMNPIPSSPFQPSTPGRMRSFVAILRSKGVPVTVRDTRGREIEAACGQLRWEVEGDPGPAVDRSPPDRRVTA